MKVNIVGDVFNSTGFSTHARELALALSKKNDVSVETHYQQNAERTHPDTHKLALNDYSQEKNVLVTTPFFWPIKLSERVETYPFGVFEGTQVCYQWAELAEDARFKKLLVPSTHTKKAYRAAGVKKTIDVIPEGVDINKFTPQPKQKEFEDTFNFLFSGGWARGIKDRKGLDFVLKAFTDEFQRDEKVKLIAKINPVYNPLMNIVKEIEKLKLRPTSQRPPVVLLSSSMKTEDMPKLYNSTDVMCVTSKAEAYGLMYPEAMACGKPCIATDYGGQTDYLNDKNSWLVDVKEMKPATDEWFYEDALWAEPDVEQLQAIMRGCFENQDKVKTKGEQALKDSKNLTWDIAAKKLTKAIGK